MVDEKRSRPQGVDAVKRHIDDLLDEALGETFPASDPVSIPCGTCRADRLS